jgi:hypothetical protein
MFGGDQRRIRLAYALLASMPGRPVLRYGDEIGMGEDLALAGRDAIRTPMQWDATPGAGFTAAAADRYVRPLVRRGPYGYRSVNVRAQREDAQSLLRWFWELFGMLRECPEVATSPVEVLDVPLPRPVLAHRYATPDGSLVLLHNLGSASVRVDVPLPEAVVDVEELFADDAYGPVDDSLGRCGCGATGTAGSGSAPPTPSAGPDDREDEAVVALDADRLERGRGDIRPGGQLLEQPPRADDVRPLVVAVDDRPAAHHVVDDHDRPGTTEAHRPVEVVGVRRLVGVGRTPGRNGCSPSRSSAGSVSSAGPTRTATRSATPARARFARATAACRSSSSSVTSRPSGGSARASQIVLYPPRVPISRTRRALAMRARRCRKRPCVGDTWIGGSPAAALAASAASMAGSASSSSPAR